MSEQNSEDTFLSIGEDYQCYAFKEEYRDTFIQWHSTTRWSLAEQEKKSRKKKIIWGKRKNALGWQHFTEAARRQDGAPSIVCNRCNSMLKHPAIHGTSGMDSHLKSVDCQKTSRAKGLTQLTISEGFRAGVLPELLP